MAEDPCDGGLERFLAERGGHLLRAAVLLTGSKEAGEDLVQAALERLLLRRGSAVHGDPEAYLRRIIYHLAADGWRRRGRWRARLALLRGDGEAADVLGCSASTVRSSVARGLHRLRELSGASVAVAADQVAADQRGRAQ
jgi:DNA-directed RNA polymerase specialized sigma24 family protein